MPRRRPRQAWRRRRRPERNRLKEDVDAAARTRRHFQARRQACRRCRRPVHDEELLPGRGALEGPALFPLQHAASTHGYLDAGPHRQRPAALGGVGRLQRRLSGRKHQEPAAVQDRQGALRRPDGRGEGGGRPDRSHTADAPRLGWPVQPLGPGHQHAVDLRDASTRPARSCRCSRRSTSSAWCR